MTGSSASKVSWLLILQAQEKQGQTKLGARTGWDGIFTYRNGKQVSCQTVKPLSTDFPVSRLYGFLLRRFRDGLGPANLVQLSYVLLHLSLRGWALRPSGWLPIQYPIAVEAALFVV